MLADNQLARFDLEHHTFSARVVVLKGGCDDPDAKCVSTITTTASLETESLAPGDVLYLVVAGTGGSPSTGLFEPEKVL